MPRTPRSALVAPGETYHVIARGNNRMRIFHRKEDYASYYDLLRGLSRTFGISIHHYVLMPNHVHMLVRPKKSLSLFMQIVQSTYAKYFSKRYRHVGHVWSGRYKSLHVGSDAYLFSCGNYIELNPVRARLTVKPEGWHFSSYKTYAFGKHDDLVTIDPFYPAIGKNAEERERRYRDLLDKTRGKT